MGIETQQADPCERERPDACGCGARLQVNLAQAPCPSVGTGGQLADSLAQPDLGLGQFRGSQSSAAAQELILGVEIGNLPANLPMGAQVQGLAGAGQACLLGVSLALGRC
ncbi:hypothetical protein D9M70_438150 [compost metagenome]